VNEELGFLDNVQLSIDQREWPLTEFERKNADVILNWYESSEPARHALLHQFGELFPTFLALTLALLAFRDDLSDVSSKLWERLKPGDHVRFRGALARVRGFDKDARGKQAAVLQFADLISYVPRSMSWQIRVYEGRARRLNKYPARRPQRRSSGGVLKDIFEVEDHDMNIVNQRRVIVVQPKALTFSVFRSLNLNGAPFASLVPSGYYSRADGDPERLAPDRRQRTPVVQFVSDTSVARELISENHDIRSVLINASESHAIRNVASLKQVIGSPVRTMVYAGEKSSIADVDFLRDLGLNLWEWRPDELPELHLQRPPRAQRGDSRVTRYHRLILNTQSFRRETLLIDAGELSNIRERAVKTLELLEGGLKQNDEVAHFMGMAYRILIAIQNTPYPFQVERSATGEVWIERVLGELRRRKIYMLAEAIDKSAVRLLDDLVDDLSLLVKTGLSVNKKACAILERIERGTWSSHGILVRRSRDVDLVNRWLRQQGIEKERASALSLSSLSNHPIVDTLFIPGWFTELRRGVLDSRISARQLVLMYPWEKRFLEAHLRSKAVLQSRIGTISDARDNAPLQEPLEIPEEEPDITEILNRIQIPAPTAPGSRSTDDMVKAVWVQFSEDYGAYLTAGFKARVLDRVSEEIVYKPVDELEEGDETVWPRGEGYGDLFDALLTAVEEVDPNVRKTVALSDLWQEELREFATENCLSSRDVARLLSRYGIDRHPTTVRGWIWDPDVIAPNNEAEVFEALAHITKKDGLLNRREEILDACARVRALHVQLGRYLARQIVHSVVNAGPPPDILAGLNVDLNDYALVAQVLAISKEPYIVPTSEANRLRERW